MPIKRDPFGFEIYYLTYWITCLEQDLEKNYSWSLIKSILTTLSNFKKLKTVDFIGEDSIRLISSIDVYYADENVSLNILHRRQIKEKIIEWRAKVEEISLKWVLCIPTVSIAIEKLIDGLSSFLSNEEISVLEKIEIDGLNESASCLLHNSFTSAEFIALRSIESILRRWYEKKTGNIIKRDRWGDILNELNKLYPNASERPKGLALLDYLRQRRNEIDHPDAISTADEATATFFNAIAVCKAVRNELIR